MAGGRALAIGAGELKHPFLKCIRIIRVAERWHKYRLCFMKYGVGYVPLNTIIDYISLHQISIVVY